MRNIGFKLFVALTGAVFLTFKTPDFNGNFEVTESGYNLQPAYLNVKNNWVDSVFGSLSTDERIAQLIMIDAYSDKDKKYADGIEDLVERYNVGGIMFLKGDALKQAELTNQFQSKAKTPMLIAMDAEWGLAMRLKNTVSYPKQITLGAITDNQLIYKMAADIAKQLKEIGVQVSFSPVVDVNNNPGNPVINSRSFGENKDNVAQKGLAYMMGLQDNHIIATAKHFPGHGDTDTDSHLSLPAIHHGPERLVDIEMYPFQQLINSGLTAVMAAHLNVPALDSTPGLPSSLSKNIVTHWLRDSLGFNGLVFTDALNMGGVSNQFKEGELELEAIQAGNDIVLMPADVPKTIDHIKKAIEKGQIEQAIIDEKCYKVLACKYWAGLNEYKPINLTGLSQRLNPASAKVINYQLAENSITLLKNHNILLPFKRLDTLRMASVAWVPQKPTIFNKGLAITRLL
ncbi:MAG: hypothetical protein HC896_05810 [Bacteroidales bacterium]|nr:hypothetical protein [Bacteroidales bacterium]